MQVGPQFRHTVKTAISQWPLLHDLALKLNTRENIFSRAYSCNAWGSRESGSGTGSELGATDALRAYLPELFEKLRIRRFVDAPCGDWNWMRLVNLDGIDYVGIDVVPQIIARNQTTYGRPGVAFWVADLTDLTKDPPPRADLILCRDCWVHLSFRDAAAMLENFRRSGTQWLLVSNSPQVHENGRQLTGWNWRYLNLHVPPFNFPQPIEARKDHYPDHGFEITLWKIADLPRIHA